MKEDSLRLKGSASSDQHRSSASLHARSSDKQPGSVHRTGVGKSKSDHFALTTSKHMANVHHIDRVSGGRLDKSSSDGRYDSLNNRSDHATEDKHSTKDQPNDQAESPAAARSESSIHSSEDDISSQDSSCQNESHSPPCNQICQVHSICQSIVSKVASVVSPSSEPVCSGEQLLDHVSSGNLVKTGPRKLSASDQSAVSHGTSGILVKSSSLKLAGSDRSVTHGTSGNLAKSSSVKFAESESSSNKLVKNDQEKDEQYLGRISSGNLARSSSKKLVESEQTTNTSESLTIVSELSTNASSGLQVASPSGEPFRDESSLDRISSTTLAKSSSTKIVESDQAIEKIGSYKVASDSSTTKSGSGEQVTSPSGQPSYSSHALNKGGSGKIVKSLSKLLSSDSDQLIWQRRSEHSVRSVQQIGSTSDKQSYEGSGNLIESSSRKLILSDLVLDQIGSRGSSGEHATTTKIRSQQTIQWRKHPDEVDGQATSGLRSAPKLPMVDVDLGERPEVDGEAEVPEHVLLTSYYG